MVNKKALLIMGGFAQVCDIVQDAKNNGIHVIVTDYLEDSPAKKIADESYMVSITDVDGIVNLCRERNVDGVMNYCIDPGQKPYQQICERLGLPCYGTKEQFDIMTNKDLFKKACIENGLDIIPSYYLDEDCKEEDLEKIQYPVVIKPADGRASKGTTLCKNKSEVKSALKLALEHSDRKKVIVEKFITGQEVVIKYFIRNGEIALTSMADLFTCYRENGERAYIGTQIFPSKYYKKFIESTDTKVRSMIKNLGIMNGAMSFDGFVDGDKFRFFDPSFRMGGAQDWRIVSEITGVNISQLLTEFALYGKIEGLDDITKLDKKFDNKAAAMLYFLAREGKIGKIHGVEKASEHDSVIGYHLSHNEGDVISKSGTSDHVVMRFLMVSDDMKKLKSDIDHLQKLIFIEDENGQDMMLPNFDVNLI